MVNELILQELIDSFHDQSLSFLAIELPFKLQQRYKICMQVLR